jgi:glucokinase
MNSETAPMQAPTPAARASATGLRRPWLVADIGGTNARFGYIAADGDDVLLSATLPGAAHSGPGAAAQAYLRSVAQQLGTGYQSPCAAAFAVATAVAGDRVAFTNSGWAFSRAEVQRELGLDELLLLNDFEALALSLPRLQPAQLRAVPAPRAVPLAGAACAVIGPGTGLGVAGLARTRHGWVALPGEGGHATLSATDDFEHELLAAVRHRLAHPHAHVSAERLLSGIGLPLLHGSVAAVLGQPAGEERRASEIVAHGLNDCAQPDALCQRTVDVFCALLGGFAGNVALTLGARGGVYIGGGIVPRLGNTFFQSRFRERFEAKGRFNDYLAAVPTWLILDTTTALSGAAQALSQAAGPSLSAGVTPA